MACCLELIKENDIFHLSEQLEQIKLNQTESNELRPSSISVPHTNFTIFDILTKQEKINLINQSLPSFASGSIIKRIYFTNHLFHNYNSVIINKKKTFKFFKTFFNARNMKIEY